MAIWAIILRFFKGLGWKNILLVLLVLVVAFTLWKVIGGKPKPQPITSLFTRIEYVQDLKLITHYYEELLTIGTPERLEEIVDQYRVELLEVERKRIELETLRNKAEDQLNSIIHSFFEIDSTLQYPKLKYIAARDRFELIKGIKFKAVLDKDGNFKEILKDNRWKFGTDVENAWTAYKVAAPEGKRAEKKARAKLKVQVRAAEALLKNERNKFLELYNIELAKVDKERKRLLKAKKSARKTFDAAQTKVDKIADEENRARQKLANAEMEAAKNEEDRPPRLVTVVFAQITGYVDLTKLEYVSRGDSIIITNLPEPQLDSVLITLDKNRIYPIDDKSKGIDTKEGRYYEVFQQMKEAIGEARDRVKSKAIDAGIKEETTQLAKDYLRDFALGLGYKLYFELPTPDYQGNYIPDLIAIDSANVASSDSFRLILDSVQMRIDSVQKETETNTRGMGGIDLSIDSSRVIQ